MKREEIEKRWDRSSSIYDRSLTEAQIDIWNLLSHIRELEEGVKLYKDYNKLLVDELNEVVMLAHVHGWRSTRVEQGKEMRDKIDKLQKPLEDK